MIPRRVPIPRLALAGAAAALLAGCGGGPTSLNLMPAPAAFTETGLPWADERQVERVADSEMEPVFFATDRAGGDGESGPAYTNDRGGALRVGTATVVPGRNDMTWADARRIALLKNSGENFPIQVGSVREYGILPSSISAFSPLQAGERDAAEAAARRYAREINAKLARSRGKDIHIYIHGYRTVFESPILTTAELWHYLGNDGVFIAYSWPATPKALAYFSDAETAAVSSRHLRAFLRFLDRETDAARINVLAYSAGTRLLTRTLGDLALEDRTSVPSLGTAVLIASDVDRGILAGHLSDGLLEVVDQLVVYQSEADLALKVSRFLTNSGRAGQPLDPDRLTGGTIDFLRRHPELELVDVSGVDSARKGNGHGYLRSSPWVSSDLLMTLAFHRSPERRGLVRDGGEIPVWVFPEDYPTRLREALIRERPELARGFEAGP